MNTLNNTGLNKYHKYIIIELALLIFIFTEYSSQSRYGEVSRFSVRVRVRDRQV